MMRNLRVWKHHTSTNIKTGWNEECINRADIWTKIAFGCNSDKFRGCLIKYYAWSMCLSNRVHPSMFVQVCLSEHVCSTNHQKIWTPLFLVRKYFFYQKPSRMVGNSLKTSLWSELQYFSGPDAISVNEYHQFGAKSNSIRSHIKINTKIIYLCYPKFCDLSNKMNFNKFPIQVWPRCY